MPYSKSPRPHKFSRRRNIDESSVATYQRRGQPKRFHSSEDEGEPGRGRDRSKPLPFTRTSWEPLAKWYDGWVGAEGSQHHQKLAIPAVLEMLQVQQGEQILDVGCGQGVLAPYITKAGGAYTGIDTSKTLIQLAQEHHRGKGQFIVGDARKLTKWLPKDQFDKAVLMLCIQDMDPLEPIFDQLSQVIKPNGQVVILMMHPCFRIPRQSGWGFDEGRQLTYRRVDHYLTPLSVPLKAYSGHKVGISLSFHRPLSSYFAALNQAKFAVDKLVELPGYKRENTQSHEAKAMNRAHEEIPLFLGLRAVKINLP